MVGRWCCHLTDQFVLLSFRHIYRGLSLHPLEVAESLPAGSGEDWFCWRALNRLDTGLGRAKTVMSRWGYRDDAQSVDCDCDRRWRTSSSSCRLPNDLCTSDDLTTVTERAKACACKWKKIVWRTRPEEITSTRKPVLARAPSNFTKTGFSESCRLRNKQNILDLLDLQVCGHPAKYIMCRLANKFIKRFDVVRNEHKTSTITLWQIMYDILKLLLYATLTVFKLFFKLTP